ncbi:MAG: winged helix DNA-binding domain-containing protein [Chloroflexota bacterium]
MTTRPHLDTAERRARLAVRHRLAPAHAAATVAEAAAAMTVLHATDPSSVYLQAHARVPGLPSPAAIEHALYAERSVLKLLAMRRTLFLAALPDVPMIHNGASLAIGRQERIRTEKLFAEGGIVDPPALFVELEAAGLIAVRERGEATTAELTKLDPRLGQRIALARGKSYEGSISVSQKVFFHLALDGLIGRGKPRGSWTGNQVRWSPIERWLPDGIPTLPVDEAQARLVERWLRTFGPGTRDDLTWWTGWTVAATRAALAAIGAQEVTLDGGATAFVAAGDVVPTPSPTPWLAFLPALDATTMGWKDRDWYLGPHRPALYDRNGNAGPTIWVDGRVVGGWGHRADGTVAWRLLEDVGAEMAARIAEEAARLADWIGPARVNAMFPTPLELELKAGSIAGT